MAVVLKFASILLVLAVIPFASASHVKDEEGNLVDDAFLNAYCASVCTNLCNAYPESNDFCNGHDYDGIKKCTVDCEKKPTAEVASARRLSQKCASCKSADDCAGVEGSEIAGYLILCPAVAKKRDMVEFFANANKESNPSGCPVGATLSADGSRCECPPGTEYNSRHSACVNLEKMRDNVNTFLSFIPDETLIEMARNNAPPELKAKLDALRAAGALTSVFGYDGESNIADLVRDYLSGLLVNGLARDTKQLRDVIKALGKKRTEALIKALELVLGDGTKTVEDQEATPSVALTPPPTGDSAQEATPAPTPTPTPTSIPTPTPEPETPYFKCNSSSECPAGYSCNILTDAIYTKRYMTVCSVRSCRYETIKCCRDNEIQLESGDTYCVLKK